MEGAEAGQECLCGPGQSCGSRDCRASYFGGRRRRLLARLTAAFDAGDELAAAAALDELAAVNQDELRRLELELELGDLSSERGKP